MSANIKYAKENLSSLVIDYIKDKILEGELKAGERIIESKISGELSISRAPVREALSELQKEGLITVTPRKGAYITEFSIVDIKEIFDIRLHLEEDILQILIQEDLITEDDINHLKQIVDKMVSIANSSGEVNKKAVMVNLLDMEFHAYIWHKSGSIRREKILKDIFFQLRMAMMYDTNMTADLYNTASDHYYIIESLENKDLEACKRYLRDHIITYREKQ